MIDRDQLRLLLVDQNLTHAEAATALGCSRPAVSRLAKQLGIVREVDKSRTIDTELLKQAVAIGMSFSEFGRQHGFNVGVVSAAAKRHGIKPPGTNHLPTVLPDGYLERYRAGTSLYRLTIESGIPVNTLQRIMRRLDREIVFRTRDEAIRPALLNDRNALYKESQVKSYRTIARELGIRPNTVCAAARRLGLGSPFLVRWDDIEYERLAEAYLERSLLPSQIACEFEYPYQVVLRQLRRFGFPINAAGGISRPSKYPELNDSEWLVRQYSQFSAGSIATTIGAPIGLVFYHLRRHGIKLRPKEEYVKLLLQHVHGIVDSYRDIPCQSQLEKQFLASLPENAQIEHGIGYESEGSYCVIDFQVDGQLIEVKPKEVLSQRGPDRRRMVKQNLICKKNNQPLKVWTKAGYWDGKTDDDDTYYAMNWRLCFDSPEACAEWLLARGFIPPKYPLLTLADAAVRMNYTNANQELNANFNNTSPSQLTTHFFPHFWYSTHKGYLPPSAAWEQGNHTVLKRALEALWQRRQEVSIYGLLKYITKYFKDFVTVSLFKPWIAAYVYDRYLPEGGTVIDPSCGWGGRFMATAGRDIKYIGYDLNPLSITSHQELADFLGQRIKQEPEFIQADSVVAEFAKGDLLFTSPPYDDTEIYYGVKPCADTGPIYENIFQQRATRLVALNVPNRHVKLVEDAASKYWWKELERLEMKTGQFMVRTATSEPILVYERM